MIRPTLMKRVAVAPLLRPRRPVKLAGAILLAALAIDDVRT